MMDQKFINVPCIDKVSISRFVSNGTSSKSLSMCLIIIQVTIFWGLLMPHAR